MKNDPTSQLLLIGKVYARKLQRLEIQYQKSLRKLEEERARLDSLKQDLKKANQNLKEEKQAWVLKAEKEPQTREKILNMRYSFNLLQEKIGHIESNIEKQNQTITEHERITKELKNALVKMNIKVEKLSFIREQSLSYSL